METEIEIYKGQTITFSEWSNMYECDIRVNQKIRFIKGSTVQKVRKQIDKLLVTYWIYLSEK